jgi:predicted dehydrogenase
MKEFLDHPGLDVVSICTPSGYHLEPACAAAEAGKHVIVEKPLEVTLERCDRIIETCEKKRVYLAGIFPSRFNPVAGKIKQAVDAGRFGRLTLGDAYVKWLRTQEYYDDIAWHGTWKLDGGGALMNQSIHAIDLLQWFMGPIDYIQGFIDTAAHQRIEVEDNAVAVLKYKNGALGVIEGSTSVYPGFRKKLDIAGIDGSVVLEEDFLTHWEFKHPTPEDERIQENMKSASDSDGGAADPSTISYLYHRIQFEDFFQAIESGGKPLVDGHEARKAVEIILAVYRSARERTIVPLPL